MAEVWRVTDRRGREVVLTEDDWRHVVLEHPPMVGREEDVRAAVEQAEMINRDRRRAHRECHYRRPGPDRARLKVVIHYSPVPPQGTWAGRVITAYPVEVIPAKEQQLWP
jgi:hypothetical protein